MRSPTVPRADSTMTGVRDLRRMARSTDSPSISGSIRSRIDERRIVQRDRGERGLPVARLADGVALAFEVHAHETQDLLVVVDDEDGTVGLNGHHTARRMVIGDRAMTAPIRPWVALSDGLTAAATRPRPRSRWTRSERPPRSASSPCSGRGCRPARPGSPRPSDAGVRASSAVAEMSMPGVQKPHWTPPASRNARWSGLQVAVRGQALDRRDRDGRSTGARGTSTSSRAGRRAGPCRRRTRSRRSPPWCRSGPGRRAGPTAASGRARSRPDTRSR